MGLVQQGMAAVAAMQEVQQQQQQAGTTPNLGQERSNVPGVEAPRTPGVAPIFDRTLVNPELVERAQHLATNLYYKRDVGDSRHDYQKLLEHSGPNVRQALEDAFAAKQKELHDLDPQAALGGLRGTERDNKFLATYCADRAANPDQLLHASVYRAVALREELLEKRDPNEQRVRALLDGEEGKAAALTFREITGRNVVQVIREHGHRNADLNPREYAQVQRNLGDFDPDFYAKELYNASRWENGAVNGGKVRQIMAAVDTKERYDALNAAYIRVANEHHDGRAAREEVTGIFNRVGRRERTEQLAHVQALEDEQVRPTNVQLRGTRAEPPKLTADLTPAPSPATTEAPQVHTVRAGQTLWSIAREHGISVQRLAELNGIKIETDPAGGRQYAMLHRGEELRLNEQMPAPEHVAPRGSLLAAHARHSTQTLLSSLEPTLKAFNVSAENMATLRGAKSNEQLFDELQRVLTPPQQLGVGTLLLAQARETEKLKAAKTPADTLRVGLEVLQHAAARKA